MQPFWMVMAFMARVVIFAIFLFWLSMRYFTDHSWQSCSLQAVGSYLLSLAICGVDEVFIYPNFRNPLRKLTTKKSGYNARQVVESPRGKSLLRWMNENPRADMFHSVGKLGQSVLYPVAPDALRDILSTNAYDFQKPLGLRAYLWRFIGWSLITLEGDPHKSQRKMLYPSFNIKHIRALYPVMWSKAGTLLNRIEEQMQTEGKMDIVVWASRYALDIIGVAALSRDFNALGMAGNHPISESFAVLLEPDWFMLIYLVLSIAIPPSWMDLMPLKANKVIKIEAQSIRSACEEILDTKRAQKSEKTIASENNILSSIISDNDLDRTQIVDHMLTMIGAGHETSASSITWATHLLTLEENLHYQDIIRKEIRGAIPTITTADGSRRADFGASEEVLQPALETLPYLNGICEEVLRLYPAVPATLRESVRTTTVAGVTVPKGTLTVIMPYAINRNPRFWGEDADKLRPERWIDTLPDGSLRANKHGGAVSNYCEVTFLHGARACIGRDFAKSELKCAIASIFGHFEVRRMPGDDGSKAKPRGAVTTKPKGGLPVQLTPVEGW